MDWKFVWIFSMTLACTQANEGMLGEFGDLYGDPQMANHVPRLGRRSILRPNAFRFFGGGSDRGRSKLAGFFGPLFNNRYENFRYYGGRPGEELARGLLRDKKLDEEYSVLPDNNDIIADTASPVTSNVELNGETEDEDYWKDILGEATIKTVLEKMAEIGETREMIEDFNNFEKFGIGNPLPKYLARYNHFPAFASMSPKVKVESSYPNSGHQEGVLNKYKSYLPFPRRKKRIEKA